MILVFESAKIKKLNFTPLEVVSRYRDPQLGIVGSLRDRELACLVSDRQGSNFESYVWRTSHHLTILKRFSWPSLAYMCTKVA